MRYFLDISYKGTHYHGWQIQNNAKSVQETLEKALRTMLRQDVHTLGSGRTDTGVHAKQQYVQFDTDQELTPKNIINLNGILPHDIVVNAIYIAPHDASARFDAISRSYEYYIDKRPNPFRLETAYYFPRALDVQIMDKATTILLQNTDFQCFSKTHTEVEHFMCNINFARFEVTDTGLVFHITANRFLRGMVRTIVGTLIDIGINKMHLEDLEAVIKGKDRKAAGSAAPAKGLFLSKVEYPKSFLRPI